MDFNNKRIMVTGGTGSIGSKIVEKLLSSNPYQVRVYSRDEAKQFELQNQFNSEKISYLIGDVRDKDRLYMAMENVDIVFHAAALKHVPFCEKNPFEAMKTNVIGTQNVVENSLYRGVKKFIGISTDKAVNPSNVMGTTKLLAERLVINAEEYKGLKDTIFSCVRFGNVLNSRGSVLQIFKNKIEKNEPLPITDENMTRFIMSIDDAVELVLKASKLAVGGEIFILKMPTVKIIDLAKAYAEIVNPDYKFEYKLIGKKPGEKIHEELMINEETEYVREVDGMYVIPYTKKAKEHYSKFPKITIDTYSSEKNNLSVDEIKKLLVKYL